MLTHYKELVIYQVSYRDSTLPISEIGHLLQTKVFSLSQLVSCDCVWDSFCRNYHPVI